MSLSPLDELRVAIVAKVTIRRVKDAYGGVNSPYQAQVSRAARLLGLPAPPTPSSPSSPPESSTDSEAA